MDIPKDKIMTWHAILFADDASPDTETPPALRKLYNVSMIERHVRTFASLGFETITVIGPPDDDRIRRHVTEMVSPAEVRYVTSGRALTPVNKAVYLLVQAHHVYDPRAVDALIKTGPDAMLVDAGAAPGNTPEEDCRMAVVDAAALAWLLADWTDSDALWGALTALRQRGACRRLNIRDIAPYVVNLRRTLAPFWLAVKTAADERQGEAVLIDAAQKGTLDFPAQYLHPPFENWLTRQAAKTPLTPNHVTSLTNAVAFVATGLLFAGALLPGLLVALLVGVLDGVDGKLARTTIRCTRFGDRFEHIFDNLYELSWYWALGWALDALALSGVVTAFYLLDRAATGLFKHRRDIELFDYAPVDRFFRRIGGRRNIYVLMLFVGTLGQAPLTAFQAMAVWSVVTALFHWSRAAWLLRVTEKDAGAAVYGSEAAL